MDSAVVAALNDAENLKPLEPYLRKALLSWLQQCLIGYDALLEHLGHLGYRSPRELLTTPVMTLTTGGAFAEVEQRVCAKRLEDFSNDELVRLARQPLYLISLHEVIGRLLPDAWLPLMSEQGRKLMEAHGVSIGIPPANPE